MGCGCSNDAAPEETTAPPRDNDDAESLHSGRDSPTPITREARRRRRMEEHDRLLAEMLWAEQLHEDAARREAAELRAALAASESEAPRASLSEVKLNGLARSELATVGKVVKYVPSVSSSVRNSVDSVGGSTPFLSGRHGSFATTPLMKAARVTSPVPKLPAGEGEDFNMMEEPCLLPTDSFASPATYKHHEGGSPGIEGDSFARAGTGGDEIPCGVPLLSSGGAGVTPGDEIDDEVAGMGGEDDAADEEECTLCLETLEAGSELRQLDCGHFFHRACVDDWLVRARNCPLCQQDVLTKPAVEWTPPSQRGTPPPAAAVSPLPAPLQPHPLAAPAIAAA